MRLRDSSIFLINKSWTFSRRAGRQHHGCSLQMWQAVTQGTRGPVTVHPKWPVILMNQYPASWELDNPINHSQVSDFSLSTSLNIDQAINFVLECNSISLQFEPFWFTNYTSTQEKIQYAKELSPWTIQEDSLYVLVWPN